MKSKRTLLLAAFATFAILITAWGVLLARQPKEPEFLRNYEHRMLSSEAPGGGMAELFVFRGDHREVGARMSLEPPWQREAGLDILFTNADDGRTVWLMTVEELLTFQSLGGPFVVSEQDLAFLKGNNASDYVVAALYGSEPLDRLGHRLLRLFGL